MFPAYLKKLASVFSWIGEQGGHVYQQQEERALIQRIELSNQAGDEAELSL